MRKKYFLDTCVWRDFYEERISKSGRPLGKYATDLFIKIIKNKDIILYSESLIWELKKDYDENEINDMLNLLFVNNILVRIDIIKKEHLEAKQLAKKGIFPILIA